MLVEKFVGKEELKAKILRAYERHLEHDGFLVQEYRTHVAIGDVSFDEKEHAFVFGHDDEYPEATVVHLGDFMATLEEIESFRDNFREGEWEEGETVGGEEMLAYFDTWAPASQFRYPVDAGDGADWQKTVDRIKAYMADDAQVRFVISAV